MKKKWWNRNNMTLIRMHHLSHILPGIVRKNTFSYIMGMVRKKMYFTSQKGIIGDAIEVPIKMGNALALSVN